MIYAVMLPLEVLLLLSVIGLVAAFVLYFPTITLALFIVGAFAGMALWGYLTGAHEDELYGKWG